MPDRFPIDHPQPEQWFESWKQACFYYGHLEMPDEPTGPQISEEQQAFLDSRENPYEWL